MRLRIAFSRVSSNTIEIYNLRFAGSPTLRSRPASSRRPAADHKPAIAHDKSITKGPNPQFRFRILAQARRSRRSISRIFFSSAATIFLMTSPL
jgi:hypothetical protein